MGNASIGDFDGQPRQFAVKGNGPDPAKISAQEGIVKYELVYGPLNNSGKPPLGPGGVRPPMGKPPLVRWQLDGARPAPSADAGPGALRQRVAEDAGSPDAPLLFCIGVHVEPLGTTVSALARTAAEAAPAPPRPPRAKQVDGSALARPGYEDEALFLRHVADLQNLADMVERHGGKLTVQAQTPFTRKLVAAKNPLFRDLEQRGHE